jgi:peptidoglycan/LPS O-acetylase OafA/YrhL
MLLCLSFYYLVAKLDWTTRPITFNRVKPKSFFEFLEDGTIGVWFMNTDYAGLTWTLSVELVASYFIYVIALVPCNYNGRFWIYGLTLLFFYLPRVTDAYNFTQYGFDSMYAVRPSYLYDKALRQHIPTFAWGVIFADIETINIHGRRPLDVIRKLNIWAKIPLNLFLFTLFVIFGSVDIEPLNSMRAEENQTYSLTVTFGYFIGMPVSMLIAALAVFFLCLTSRVAYVILDSPPFQFLGNISYCLYLLHTLVIEWPMKELQYYWVNQGNDYDYAAYWVFLIFTPILIWPHGEPPSP